MLTEQIPLYDLENSDSKISDDLIMLNKTETRMLDPLSLMHSQHFRLIVSMC